MLSFAIMTSVISCFLTLFLFVRYVAFMPWSFSIKAWALVLALLIGLGPLFLHHSVEHFLGKFYTIHYHIIYFLLVATAITWCLTVVRDIVWLLARLFVPNMPSLVGPMVGKVNAVTILIALIASGIAVYEGMKVPPVKNITLSSPKITSEKKIVLMPDIHINRVISEDKLNKLIAQANDQQADLILLLGDIVDDAPERIAPLVQNLQKLKAKKGVYAVAGNHEAYIGYQQATKALIDIGIPVFINQGVSIEDDLFLGGIPDTTSLRMSKMGYDLTQTFQGANQKQYKILMSHTPTHFNEAPFDLEVSGHTHGGQIVPFYPLIYFFHRYVAGLYNMNADTQIYVSRGAGQWGPQMRLFAPSEMTVITLKPQ